MGVRRGYTGTELLIYDDVAAKVSAPKWQSLRLRGLLKREHGPTLRGCRAGVCKQRPIRTVVGNRVSDTHRTVRPR